MISWKDFVFDDVFGPSLVVPQDEDTSEDQQRRNTRLGGPGVMEDALGRKIQETGQEKVLARMAGKTSLDSLQIDQSGMEASRNNRVELRQRGSE